jgi:hypothetical protein
MTPLQQARLSKHVQAAAYLQKCVGTDSAAWLQKEAEEELAAVKRGKEETKQMQALIAGLKANDIGAMKRAVDAGASVTGPLLGSSLPYSYNSEQGWAAVHWAAGCGKVEVMQWLVEQGADMNAEDVNRTTALHIAACGGHFEVMKWLVLQGSSAPLAAAAGGQTEYVLADDALKTVRRGADVKAVDGYGHTVLHCSARAGDVAAIKWLVKQGVDFHAVDIKGNTALHFAAGEGKKEAMVSLVEHGANVSVQNGVGHTACQHAQHHKQVQSTIGCAPYSYTIGTGTVHYRLYIILIHYRHRLRRRTGCRSMRAQNQRCWNY